MDRMRPWVGMCHSPSSCLVFQSGDKTETFGTAERGNKTMNGAKDYHHDMTIMLAFHDALRRELGHIARVAAIRTDDPAT
jgi:hypothetical protein